VPQEIINELIEIVKENLEDVKVEDVRIGLFYTGVKLENGFAGLAFTPRGEASKATCCSQTYQKMPKAGTLTNMRLYEALELSKSFNPILRAVGIATLNAASQSLISHYPITSLDPLDLIEVRGEDTVTMVGAFPSYIRRLKEKVKELFVYDFNLEALEELGLKEPNLNFEEALKRSQVVIATGSIFVTQTEEFIIKNTRAREFILVGPTASMLPDPLFKRGVTCIGGIKVKDPDTMLRIISEAGGSKALLESCSERYTIRRT